MIEPGRSGWLTEAPGAEPLGRELGRLAAEPERVTEVIAAGGPRTRFSELNDLDEARADYAELAAAAPRRTEGRREKTRPEPLVSIVIPYYRLAHHVEETIRSAAEQTHPRTELIVINDGSFEPADAILAALAERYPLELVTQNNAGLGAARNLGAQQARGRYVLFLDADNVAHPRFVERCAAVLEADPSVAYATTWARYVDEDGRPWGAPGRGLRPLGNWTDLVEERNVAGDAAALFRRELFDRGLGFSRELTSFEDWAFYRRLHREGALGQVVPEVLLDYRIRDDSMMRVVGARNEERIEGEVRAHLAEEAIEWTMQP
jgi:glycosyltransferase involved in cell wall biosynthesis